MRRNHISFFIIGMIVFWTQSTLAATRYQYDDMGRLIHAFIDETISITYEYDNAGNQISMRFQGMIRETPVISGAGEYSVGNMQIQVSVPQYGDEYGPLTYQMAIGSAAFGTDITDWMSYEPDAEGRVTLDNLNLSYGQAYFISIRILNEFGELISQTGCSDGIAVLDPVLDSDDDGFNNQVEADAGSHPLDRYSYPGVTQVALHEGLNFIAIPEDIRNKSDLRAWLPVIGNSSEIDRVMMLDVNAGGFVRLVPEDETNAAAPLMGGEGIIVYANQQVDISFATIFCPEFDLKQGINVIGIACPTFSSTAYQLLNGLGSDNVVSIQRFSAEKGTFETAGFDGNNHPSGIDFSIVPGEGYFVFMKTDMSDVRF